MGRILAIDYGQKRAGLAVTDELKMIANGLTTVHVKDLRKQFPDMRIERMDERFTSQMALRTMIDAGLGKKARQDKALVDTISATIILQSYLEMLSNTEQRK